MPNSLYALPLSPQLSRSTPGSTPSSSFSSSTMASLPFKFRRKSLSDDSSPLPSPSSSPSKSSSPFKPSPVICTTKYRPQYSLSPPGSPQDAPISPSYYSPTRSVMKSNYQLPSFKSVFGNLSTDSHLTDDEDIPPNSDFGYNPSEYDLSDSEPLDDRLSSSFASSSSPDDRLFSDSHDRRRRLSASSEQEEDAIIGLLDLRRCARFSSVAESEYSSSSLVPAISPDTESEIPMFPPTPDDGLLLNDGEHDRIIMPVVDMSYSHPSLSSQDEVLVKMEIDDSVDTSTLNAQDEDSKIAPALREQALLLPVEAVTVDPSIGSSLAAVDSLSPPDIKTQNRNSPILFNSELLTPSPPERFSPQTQQPSAPLLECEQFPVEIKCEAISKVSSMNNRPSTPTGSPRLENLPSPSPSRLPPSSPLPCLSPSPQPEERDQPAFEKDSSEPARGSSPFSDISAQEAKELEVSRKVHTKRRSLTSGDAREVKKLKRVSKSEPSEKPRRKIVKKDARSVSRKRKSSSEQYRRSSSPLSTCSSLSSVSNCLDLGQEERQELIGMVIETLAMSRASSMDGEGVWRGVVDSRPNLITKRSKAEWMDVLHEVLDDGVKKGFFGTVASSGKDERNNPLPPRYFYVPEKDPDQERSSLLKNMMPRAAGRRSESVKYKQYYWKPLGKWSRWDAEEEI